MLRYNHSTIERKWARRWRSLEKKSTKVCTVLIPQSGDELGLENLRLLILTDFFALVQGKIPCHISIPNVQKGWYEQLNKLDYFSWTARRINNYDLAVIPRDYVHLVSSNMLQAKEILYCGRFLQTAPLGELLPDFGLDSLRLYLLNVGPVGRDYTFSWYGLVSAYRFVNKVWQLGQVCTDTALDAPEQKALKNLQETVQNRLMRQKPHTALSAIMGYIKNRIILTREELYIIVELLQPFIPFLSAELLDSMTLVKGQNGW